jgi:DNA-binding transcriptional regulator LsrR (DeoR family)
MSRLNISIPDELYERTLHWRTRVNLSEICARALQQELDALEFHRNAAELFSVLRPPTKLENEILRQFPLIEAVILDKTANQEDVRDLLGQAAGDYLNRYLCDGSLLAIGGGRQMWCVVRSLKPRQLDITITGLGFGHNDPNVLHAHSNTLTTLLWLLFSPRATARIVGRDDDNDIQTIWTLDLAKADYPKYFIVGSCGPFNSGCHLAHLLSPEISQYLSSRNACGDFLYNFFDATGNLISKPSVESQSILSAELLREMSSRTDARVVLVAGGSDKLDTIRLTLAAGLCNVLITDTETANNLLNKGQEALCK